MAKKVNLDVSEKLDITCRQGDTFSLTLTLKDSDGVALPLATGGYRFAMQVRESQSSANLKGSDGLIIGTRDIGSRATNMKGQESSFETFAVDDSGNLTVTALPSTMRDVPPGLYLYDLQQIKPNTTTNIDEHTTILRGSFRVNGDVSEGMNSSVVR